MRAWGRGREGAWRGRGGGGRGSGRGKWSQRLAVFPLSTDRRGPILFLYVFKTQYRSVARAEVRTASTSPSPTGGIAGMHHHARLCILTRNLSSVFCGLGGLQKWPTVLFINHIYIYGHIWDLRKRSFLPLHAQDQRESSLIITTDPLKRCRHIIFKIPII